MLPEFVFVNSKDIAGLDLILYTRPPYLIARAIKFESAKAMETFTIKYNLFDASMVCSDYNILICWYGRIENVQDVPILGHGISNTHLSILNKLLHFYEKERIKGNETRLKKYAR